ncbi:Asialoglycoprotein receptor 1 [Varanus komodoensis]|nr:Asialoglycoprotein receptor 1 [Varanus komodoensis]
MRADVWSGCSSVRACAGLARAVAAQGTPPSAWRPCRAGPHVSHVPQFWLLPDQKRLRVQLSNLQQDTKEVHCELVEMKSNGTKSGCCPKGWLAFKESCYWISSVTASWNNAQRDCERKQGHLVTINSPEEKVFVNQRKKPRHTWIGLTDVSGIWKWSDGTLYSFDRADWSQGQPDHWYGHGLGGGEDCVEMYPNGDWNDSHCSLLYYWICEMPLKS